MRHVAGLKLFALTFGCQDLPNPCKLALQIFDGVSILTTNEPTFVSFNFVAHLFLTVFKTSL
jgi:hypothetical protein